MKAFRAHLPWTVVDERVARIRHRRDVARNAAFGGFAILFFGGLVLRFGGLFGMAQFILSYLAMGVGILLFGAGTLAWIALAWRLHRLADPWAYDPELDGPDPRRPRDLTEDHPEPFEALAAGKPRR